MFFVSKLNTIELFVIKIFIIHFEISNVIQIILRLQYFGIYNIGLIEIVQHFHLLHMKRIRIEII